MFRLKLRGALVAFTAIAALALPASVLATNVTTWQIVRQNDPAAANTDLAPDAGTWEFIMQPGTYVTQQIAATERVALYDTTNHK